MIPHEKLTFLAGMQCACQLCSGCNLVPVRVSSRACGSGFTREEVRTGNPKPKQISMLHLWETCFHPRKDAATVAAFRTFPVRKLYS
ncbi:hypothetical protein DW66_3428 [Pseudomonas putida]|nr:hypothetical protein DW66_3428 [Pseudomonas putida]AJG12989.1 hypothetical protein RK21_01481 [Pseudomonas plecoglossicida]